MNKLKEIFHEPMNTLTHLVGAIGALIGLIYCLYLVWGTPDKMITLTIYGFAQLILYVASCLLHGVRTTHQWNFFFNRLDHMAIFLMIAGVYTPIVYHFLDNPWRWLILGFVWLFAIVGMGFKLVNREIHGFFNASIYVLMSWGTAVPILLFFDVSELFSQRGLGFLLGGGLVYTIGFIIYYLEKPDPWPEILGHHEIWHLFVIGGSLFHFLFMLTEVVPLS
ncbi:MAG: hemolysin III family protein [Chloroflexota bacterium]